MLNPPIKASSSRGLGLALVTSVQKPGCKETMAVAAGRPYPPSGRHVGGSSLPQDVSKKWLERSGCGSKP